MAAGLLIMLVGLGILIYHQSYNRAILKARVSDLEARMQFISKLAQRGDLSTMETIRQISQGE